MEYKLVVEEGRNMNALEFNKVLEERCKKMQDTLNKKSAEYSTNENKLHNFNRAAETLGSCPEKALIGMAIKHWVSILDIVDKIDKNLDYPDKFMIDEKIGDMINYLVLLEAMIKEHITPVDTLTPDNTFVGIGSDE